MQQGQQVKAKGAPVEILKGAKMGEVVTRFPPEPSGYLHVGHIKASVLNYHYAKKYDGKMLLRFDDTNPTKEKQEYQDAILADLKTLGIEYAKMSYSSDYFDKAEEYCRQLLREGKAYLDNTPVEKMRDERFKGVPSVCREQTPEVNLELFEKMLKGAASDYCVRAKIDMLAKNKCMRDPVLYRTNDTPHHRTGTKYKAYPTYDFVCPVLDSIEGVTHAMRTNEYSDRIEQYHWVINALGLRDVEIYEFSRLNFVNTCLSKRKLQQFVDENFVEGWQDPRFPTLRGILRRGVTVQTLTEFMIEQGPSVNANLQEWDKLWANNIKHVDPVSPRYTAVGLENIALISFVNYKGHANEVITVPQHPKNPELGDRPLFKGSEIFIENEDATTVQAGEKITLMRWGNIKILTKEEVNGQILMTAEDLPDDKDYKGTKKFTWLAKGTPSINVDLVEYDHLIRVKKVEDHLSFQDIVNPVSKYVTKAIADAGIKSLAKGQFLQFERRGFFIIDEATEDKYTLIYIPDGKTKAASIQTKVDQASISQGKQELESKSKAKKQEKKQKQEQVEQPKVQEQPKEEPKVE